MNILYFLDDKNIRWRESEKYSPYLPPSISSQKISKEVKLIPLNPILYATKKDSDSATCLFLDPYYMCQPKSPYTASLSPLSFSLNFCEWMTVIGLNLPCISIKYAKTRPIWIKLVQHKQIICVQGFMAKNQLFAQRVSQLNYGHVLWF